MSSDIERTRDPEEPDPEPIRPGVQVASYRVGQPLGAGGYGTVFAARHTGLDKPVVLKVLHARFAMNPTVVRRFLREGRAASKIRHPHVVDVTDVGTYEGVPYLVMERLEGEDLGERLDARSRLPLDEALAVVIPLMDALARAHSLGIVHRDLKPSNIFIAREPQGEVPKLLDFGIAKLLDGPEADGPTMTKSGSFMGTPQYASPEQARNARNVGPATDQYSLAAILFELVSGESPFAGDNPYAVLAAVIAGERRSLAEFCPEQRVLEAVLDRAMQMDPAARYSCLREMGRDLLRLASATTRERWSSAFEGGTETVDLAETPEAALDAAAAEAATAETFDASSLRATPSTAGPVVVVASDGDSRVSRSALGGRPSDGRPSRGRTRLMWWVGAVLALLIAAGVWLTTSIERSSRAEPAASSDGRAEVRARPEPRAVDAGSGAEAVPAEAVPAEAVPAEAVPAEAVPAEAVPAEAVPAEAVPAEAVPAEAVPAEAVPAEEPVDATAVEDTPAPTTVIEEQAADAPSADTSTARRTRRRPSPRRASDRQGRSDTQIGVGANSSPVLR